VYVCVKGGVWKIEGRGARARTHTHTHTAYLSRELKRVVGV
jgi:hypothetical protein